MCERETKTPQLGQRAILRRRIFPGQKGITLQGPGVGGRTGPYTKQRRPRDRGRPTGDGQFRSLDSAISECASACRGLVASLMDTLEGLDDASHASLDRDARRGGELVGYSRPMCGCGEKRKSWRSPPTPNYRTSRRQPSKKVAAGLCTTWSAGNLQAGEAEMCAGFLVNATPAKLLPPHPPSSRMMDGKPQLLHSQQKLLLSKNVMLRAS